MYKGLLKLVINIIILILHLNTKKSSKFLFKFIKKISEYKIHNKLQFTINKLVIYSEVFNKSITNKS